MAGDVVTRSFHERRSLRPCSWQDENMAGKFKGQWRIVQSGAIQASGWGHTRNLGFYRILETKHEGRKSYQEPTHQ